ncbi:MAG TPA: TonB-dependent receptor plug domain-containing protein [Candidatus Didemnitutus sp.]|nr:TonB-dependent receptor plug domain-containing protein [Candidatus Didemnitutus sp.]
MTIHPARTTLAALTLLGCALRLPAQTAAATTPPADKDKDVVVLSPFVVDADEGSDSYKATDTLAGTRTRTNLNDLGSAISVVTSKFMSDIGATNAQSLLQYTTNTEVGGLYGNFGGMGNNSTISESSRLLQPDNDTRVRGLAAADNTRNYFLTDIPWDNFNVDRVDMQRGPNSMLFGNGSPAGIINTSLNDAMFRDAGKIEFRFDQYGSLRSLLDDNVVLIPDQLSIRVVGLDDREKFRQEGTYNNQKRAYGAVRWDPKWFEAAGGHTDIRINDEYGDVKSRNPRTLPPLDQITPWYNNLNQLTLNPYVAHQTNGIAGGQGSPNFNPWINGARGREFWSDPVATFTGNGVSTADNYTESYDLGTVYGIGVTNNSDHSQPTRTTFPVTGAIPGGVAFAQPVGIVTYSQYATFAGLPGAQYGAYRDKMLTDPSIFNFYDQTLDGPNTHQWQHWNGFNADFSQTLFDNRIGLDLAYYTERFVSGGENYLNDQNYAIAVDVNSVMPNGAPNPNVGRPYIETDDVYGNSENQNRRTSWRAIAFGDLRGSDLFSNKTLQKIFGDHHFTGVVSQDTLDTTSKSWSRWDADESWLANVGGSQSLNGGSRNVDVISYIGPSLQGTSSASGLNLNGLTTMHVPIETPSVAYFDSHWNHPLDPTAAGYVDPNAPYTLPIATAAYGTQPGDPALLGNQSQNPANYIGWTSANTKLLNADNGDIKDLYFAGSKTRSQVTSEAFSWQGYMFDNTVIPAFGWRKDKVTLAASAAPYIDAAQGLVDPDNYGSGPTQLTDTEDSRTWSIVVHTPSFLKKHLPSGVDISVFYDKSSNFQAQSIRKDFLGNGIPDATGTTYERGFTISALDGKIAFKANWYDTKVQNASLTGNQLGSNSYMLYLLPTWAAAHAEVLYAGLTNQNINGVSVQGEPWFWDYSSQYGGTPYGAQPRTAVEATIDAQEMASIKAFADNSLPQSFYDVYGMPISVANMKAGNWLNAVTQPNWNPVTQGAGALQSSTGGTVGGISPSATVDTESKGVELELYAQPMKNWSLTVNAAKDTSTRQNLNKTLVALIDAEETLWNSAAGQIHLWSAGGQTMQAVFNQNIYGPYQNLLAQAGTQVPELRPWHVNAVTSYSFDHGLLKDVFVGGGYRWEQGEILGYALNPTTQLIDVNKPYHGPSDDNFDLWVGYSKKLSAKINWKIQLNLHNVGRSPHLVPIAVEPDGSPAMFRIEDGQLWQITNTFSF